MQESNIKDIKARMILDSRGNPTVEADVILVDGTIGRAAVPSGASTGAAEALELRDGGDAWGGKGVNQAVDNINNTIRPELIGKSALDQTAIDQIMLQLDGTDNKANLGANAILAVSLATAKAAAKAQHLPLWRYISQASGVIDASLPMPMVNLINGGAHANWTTDIQEYMVIPVSAHNYTELLRMTTEVFHKLGQLIKQRGYPTTVGDEGGYAPHLTGGNGEPLQLLEDAIMAAGYKPGEDFKLGLDIASSEFFKDGQYQLKNEQTTLASEQMIDYIAGLADKYPLATIEDGLAEEDWTAWTSLTERIGNRMQLVGDDLLVTNVKRLQKAIDNHAGNAILIKPNQIGSLSETIDAVKLAKANGFNTVMSHRSGETEDVTIAHLAVGLNCGQIKTGSVSRTDRVAKYNELLRISETAPQLQIANPFN